MKIKFEDDIETSQICPQCLTVNRLKEREGISYHPTPPKAVLRPIRKAKLKLPLFLLPTPYLTHARIY